MVRFILAIVFASASAIFWTFPAMAEPEDLFPHCGKYDEMLEMLITKYNERPVAMAFIEPKNGDAGGFVQVTRTPDGSTWTIIVTSPGSNKMTCMVASGTEWHSLYPMAGTGL